ncbi:DMT family transporter [Profundibacter sp.]|uniref:DMT family transporter n=1 Tax=Profundibacter sp. TaxID=3101071 RepID=UPI003D14EE43
MRALSDNMRGALLMMGSMAAFVFNDACMKVVLKDLPLFQAILLRGLATVFFMVLVSRWLGGLDFRLPRRDWFLVALRTMADVGATYFFITALREMPIANITAILQVLPLTVTLTGAMLFGEPLGWRRLVAIMIGFVGVMIIVRPSVDGFNSYAFYALIAVAFVTVRDLCARRLSAGVSSVTIALIGATGVVTFAAIGAIGGEWVPVSGSRPHCWQGRRFS